MTSLENTTKDIKDMLKISNNKVYNRLGSKKKADKPQDSSNVMHKETTYNRKSPPLEVCHSQKSSIPRRVILGYIGSCSTR